MKSKKLLTIVFPVSIASIGLISGGAALVSCSCSNYEDNRNPIYVKQTKVNAFAEILKNLNKLTLTEFNNSFDDKQTDINNYNDFATRLGIDVSKIESISAETNKVIFTPTKGDKFVIENDSQLKNQIIGTTSNGNLIFNNVSFKA